MINLMSSFLVKSNVPAILVDAGGVTKNTCAVTNKLNRANFAIFIDELWHIQYFSRSLSEVRLQLARVSEAFVEIQEHLHLRKTRMFF